MIANQLSMSSNKIGAGLSNLGNTCFFNAVMQIALHTAPLVKHLDQKSHSSRCKKNNWCIFCALENLWNQSSKSRVVNPRDIVSNLKVIFKKFRLGRQQDSHQYLRYLIEGLQDAETGVLGKDREANQKRLRKTLIFNIFGGRIRTFVLCLGCNHESLTEERYYDMNIECQKSNSLNEGLNNFFTVDELTGSNKYRCQNCKHMNNAKKGFTILTLPKVLTFQLKRFTNSLRKIGKAMNFPKRLNMHKYLSDPQSLTEEQCKYQLYGVTVHAGSSSYSGHYFSFVRCDLSNNVWYEMNDSNVSKCGEDRVMSQQAYLLFYVRTGKQSHPKEQPSKIIQEIVSKQINNIQSFKKQKADGTHQKIQIQNENQSTRIQKKQQNITPYKSIEKQQKHDKSFAGKTDQDLAETKRKLSLDFEQLKKSAKNVNSHPQQAQGVGNVILNGITISNNKFGEIMLNGQQQNHKRIKKSRRQKRNRKNDDDENIPLPPTKLIRRRSKQQALQQMTLLQMILKYSTKLLQLQGKLPRDGIGHRVLRSMNILRRSEMVMKRRKIN